MATIPTQTQTKSKKPAKTERHYIVSYVPNRGDTSTPALNLSGKWLREVGFETGTGVTAKIAGDCIVLIPETDEVRELKDQLARMKEMIKNGRKNIF